MNTQTERPRRRSRRTPPGAAHFESFRDSRTGESIHVVCICSLGESHSYEAWQEAKERRLAARREGSGSHAGA